MIPTGPARRASVDCKEPESATIAKTDSHLGVAHLRVDSIEACRGIAASMVVFAHAGKILDAPANFGAYPFGHFFLFGRSGVDFFFALSGFLIAMLHWKDIGHAGRAGRYAGRRLTRVYPTYWLVLLPIIPFDYFTHTLFDFYDQPIEVIKSIVLLPQIHTIIDPTWSMRNELLFYTLFGLLILNRRLGGFVVALWLAATLVRPFFPGLERNVWTDLLTYPMNFEFLWGVAAGWAFRRITFPRPALILACGTALFVAMWTAEDLESFADMDVWLFALRSLLYGAAAVMVIAGLSTLELAGRIRLPRAMVTLGGASYLIYLIHVPALLILGSTERHLHLLRFVPSWALASLFIAATIGGGVVMHLWVEKPMLAVVRRLTGRDGVRPAPVAV